MKQSMKQRMIDQLLDNHIVKVNDYINEHQNNVAINLKRLNDRLPWFQSPNWHQRTRNTEDLYFGSVPRKNTRTIDHLSLSSANKSPV